MKKTAVNVLCSTGITLILLAVIGTMFEAKFIFISGVFESFIANIIIHIGLLFTRKLESNYAILEYTLDIGYTIAVALICGAAFNWYNSMPIWILIIMSVMVYAAGILLNVFQMRHDIKEVNKLLKKRNISSQMKGTAL